MKKIKKIVAIATVFVMLAANSISVFAAGCYGDGNHYRPPGVRCYGRCEIHIIISDDFGNKMTVHVCNQCHQDRS